MEKLMDVKQVADILNIKPSWLYSRTSQDVIPHYHVGKYVRFDIDEVRQWLEENSHESSSD